MIYIIIFNNSKSFFTYLLNLNLSFYLCNYETKYHTIISCVANKKKLNYKPKHKYKHILV